MLQNLLHSDIIGTLTVGFALFNLVMSSIQKGFDIMKRQEPEWMQKVGAVGGKIADWLSGNLQHKEVPAPVQDQVQKVQ